MKTVRDFLSEITDIDSRLLKTIIGLFRNPQRVAEASLVDDHTYTKPLRYLLFTSTAFIVWRYLYEHYIQFLFREQYVDIDDYWYLPGRIAKATSQFISFEENFFPFQILLFVVPLAIVPLRFFFLSGSWKEARYITMYSFGQFWILLMLLVPVMSAYNYPLLFILIAFGLTGIFFRNLLSKRVWTGLIKWVALGSLLTFWFYYAVLPATHIGLVQILLPDRSNEPDKPAIPRKEIPMPITANAIEPIIRDPDNRILAVLEKQEGLLITCYEPDTTLLWQIMLPGLTGTREALSVKLSESDRGILLLAEAPKTQHAFLISAKGKILFNKIYQEEMVLNGGDLINGALVLTGGKSNGEGIAPFMDVLQLNFESEKGKFELLEERTHFLPGVGNRFDDVYALSDSPGGLHFVVSQFETTGAIIGNVEINRVSIMHVKVDSSLQIVWETEIFKRTSKYWPIREAGSFQMRYDPVYQRIVAFYSLSDDKHKSAYLFSIDTLGKILLKEKIGANELTYLLDVHSVRNGIYFCGSTELGIRSPLLGFGSQGLIGFISNDGVVSKTTVGPDRQAHWLGLFKVTADSSLIVWGFREQNVLMYEGEWELMKFDRKLF